VLLLELPGECRMCGKFLRQLLAEESQHSTPVGRLLLPVLLGFRFLFLASSGPGVFNNDESEFICHLGQPGCKAACYNAFHPLSPLRFWAFQVILVAVPSVIYGGFILYHVIGYWEKSGKVKKEQETLNFKGDGSRDASGVGSLNLLWAYVAHLGARLVLEGASLGAQYHLFGFKMHGSFVCREDPCISSTTCFQSQASEKTIFLNTMFGISAICLLFTFLELVFLGLRTLWRMYKHRFHFSKYFRTSKSTTRHKDPTDDLSVVETKEPFR
uniref:Gap junction protein, gamma 3 n=1 Tax=Nannospalax galili TaxID=1026970 RepID=A0A8C6QLH8_NANGA